MIRRAMLLLLTLSAVALAPAAFAQTEYDGGAAQVTVTEDTIFVSASGFGSNVEVRFEVDYRAFGRENAAGVIGGYEGEVAFAMNVAAPMEIVQTGTTTSDADGSVSFGVDNRGEGRYEITMTDGVNTVVAMAAVGQEGNGGGAVPRGAGQGRGLPRTGSDSSIGLAQVGFAAVAIGSVALYAANRRKSKTFA